MGISTIVRMFKSRYKLTAMFPRLKIKVWEANVIEDNGFENGRLAKVVFTIINPVKHSFQIDNISLEYSSRLYRVDNLSDTESTRFPLTVPASEYSECELNFKVDTSNNPKMSVDAKLVIQSEYKKITKKIRLKNKKNIPSSRGGSFDEVGK